MSVIIFEDLHWLDEPSHDFVKTMVEAVNGTKVVMVLNYRPPWSSPCSVLPHYHELPLQELDKGDMADWSTTLSATIRRWRSWPRRSPGRAAAIHFSPRRLSARWRRAGCWSASADGII